MDSSGRKVLVTKCEEKMISNQEHYSFMAFGRMNSFRKRGQLCDVVIKVEGREFLAHRVILAASSDYFDAMFSSGMAEADQLEVELKSISPDIMEALLEYIYTGQVRVSMDNVQDLLPAASLVQMEGVKAACSNFLLAEVDASNVLGIRRFAELHNCMELETYTRNYAAHNFEPVTEFEEFLCLTYEELIDMISREDLYIDCEESVYKAVMRWVHHHSPDRVQYLAFLLKNIRLSVLSVRFLTDVVDKDPLIRQSFECRDLVDDAKRFHLRPDLRHEMRELRYRQRDGGDEYLVVIGGFGSDQNPSDSVEMFNPRTLDWSELPDLPLSYRYVAACSLDTRVYVIGGFDGRERLNTVCLLDIAQCEEGWRWLTPMHYKRGLSAACTNKGLIYVCGGFDGQSRLQSLEVYHPKIDEWRILSEMATAREGAGLVVVDDTLYCLGGYDGFNLLNTMEAFDIRRGSWSFCKPMYMRRSGAGCALLGDTIYVCGGYGGAEGQGPLHLDTVEAYNTRLAQWTLVTSMNVPRCYVGACPLAGKIYVAAGYNGSNLLDTMESYDPIENTWWLHNESRMNHERCDTGMCVVRFLACAVALDSITPSPRNFVQTANTFAIHSNSIVTSGSIPVSSNQNFPTDVCLFNDNTRNCMPTLPTVLRLPPGETHHKRLQSPFVESVRVQSSLPISAAATTSYTISETPFVSTSHTAINNEGNLPIRNSATTTNANANANNNNLLLRKTVRRIYNYPHNHCHRQCHLPNSSLLLPIGRNLHLPRTERKLMLPSTPSLNGNDERNAQTLSNCHLSFINTSQSSDFLYMNTYTIPSVHSVTNANSLDLQCSMSDCVQRVSTPPEIGNISAFIESISRTSELEPQTESNNRDNFQLSQLNKSSERASSSESIPPQHNLLSRCGISCSNPVLFSASKRFSASASSISNSLFKQDIFRSMDALNCVFSDHPVQSQSNRITFSIVTNFRPQSSALNPAPAPSHSILATQKTQSNINANISEPLLGYDAPDDDVDDDEEEEDDVNISDESLQFINCFDPSTNSSSSGQANSLSTPKLGLDDTGNLAPSTTTTGTNCCGEQSYSVSLFPSTLEKYSNTAVTNVKQCLSNINMIPSTSLSKTNKSNLCTLPHSTALSTDCTVDSTHHYHPWYPSDVKQHRSTVFDRNLVDSTFTETISREYGPVNKDVHSIGDVNSSLSEDVLQAINFVNSHSTQDVVDPTRFNTENQSISNSTSGSEPDVTVSFQLTLNSDTHTDTRSDGEGEEADNHIAILPDVMSGQTEG